MSTPILTQPKRSRTVALLFRHLLLVQVLLLAVAITGTTWSIATGIFNSFSLIAVAAWALAITSMRIGATR